MIMQVHALMLIGASSFSPRDSDHTEFTCLLLMQREIVSYFS
uniref:Uncharacterized protein n=1 Tax=Anguilla anguilla TaxID=7936 RepID=A0A0E9UIL5_ANGAN